jgi:hypothetical protein
MTKEPRKALRSEAITEEIMSEMYEEVKDFMAKVIANRKTLSFGEIEEEIRELSFRFGELVSEGALEAIGNGYVGRTIECDCGGYLEYQRDSRWILTSLNGKLNLYRAYYYCKECKSSKIPLDEQLGLEGKHQSIGVRKCMALLGMVEGFSEASKQLWELTGVSVSSKEEQIESEEIGKEVGCQEDAEVEAFWSGQKDISEIPVESSADRLYITTDGVNVRVGKETYKEVKIGSVYETALAKETIAENIRYTGGFYSAEDLGKKLYVLALKGGLKTAQEVVFLGDGARWIWNIARYHFPEAVQIVDWYHAEERLWSVGRVVYGEGTSATKKWVKARLKQLIEGKVEAVITSLSELSSSSADFMEAIESNITYFTNNKERMRYNQYKEKGYHIGSGTVESACKHIVGQRLKQAGMTWSVEGADAIIQLRILWKNGEWHNFWNNRKAAA